MMIFNPFIKMINFVIGIINNILEFVLGGLVDPINKIGGFLNSGIETLENSINGIMGLFGEQEEEDKMKLPRIPEAGGSTDTNDTSVQTEDGGEEGGTSRG